MEIQHACSLAGVPLRHGCFAQGRRTNCAYPSAKVLAYEVSTAFASLTVSVGLSCGRWWSSVSLARKSASVEIGASFVREPTRKLPQQDAKSSA